MGSDIKYEQIQDVQELIKATIPDRFVRNILERPILPSLLKSPHTIPIINLSDDANESFQLARACEEWGFFKVVNHGVDASLLENMKNITKEFFMLPLEEKRKYKMTPGNVQGYGQAFVFDEQQKLDWCNMLALGVEPHFMRSPKLWPTKPEKLSETVEIYAKEMRKLCKKLLKYIAKSLGLRGEIFEEMFGEAVQALRMNYYPQCPRPDLVLGLSPHSDGSALTVLQQTDSCVGLEVLKDNNWVSVHPTPNALVINIGDTLEVLTNGKYKSVEHRAVTNKDQDRLSIVTFYAPSYDVDIGPMSEFVNQNNPIKYRKYNHGEYSKHYVANKLQGKKTLETFAKLETKL